MEAWVNVFSFIMKSMLPPAINGQTLETEICINTKTEFSSDNMKAQVQEIKYEREKALSSYRSQQTNRTPNNTNRLIAPNVVIPNKNEENFADKSNGSSSSVDFTDRRSVTSMEDLGFSMPLRGSEKPPNSFHIFLPRLPLVISDKNEDDL